MLIYLIGIGIIGIDFSFYQSNPNGFQSLSSKRPLSPLCSSQYTWKLYLAALMPFGIGLKLGRSVPSLLRVILMYLPLKTFGLRLMLQGSVSTNV